MRNYKKLSNEFRLSIIREYIDSGCTLASIQRKYGIGRGTIPRWMRIFGIEDNRKEDSMVKKQIVVTDASLLEENRRLQQEIKSLKAELKASNMARDAYDCMIDLAEAEFRIPIRKKSAAK